MAKDKLVCIICGHTSEGNLSGIEAFEFHMADEHGVDLS